MRFAVDKASGYGSHETELSKYLVSRVTITFQPSHNSSTSSSSLFCLFRQHVKPTGRMIGRSHAYQIAVIAVSVSAGIVRLCESMCMVSSYRCSRIRSDSLYVRGSFLTTPFNCKPW